MLTPIQFKGLVSTVLDGPREKNAALKQLEKESPYLRIVTLDESLPGDKIVLRAVTNNDAQTVASDMGYSLYTGSDYGQTRDRFNKYVQTEQGRTQLNRVLDAFFAYKIACGKQLTGLGGRILYGGETGDTDGEAREPLPSWAAKGLKDLNLDDL